MTVRRSYAAYADFRAASNALLAVIFNAPETERRALLCFRGLDLTGPRRRVRDKRGDQDLGRRRDVLKREFERRFVRVRRLREAAQLWHELERRITNLRFSGWRPSRKASLCCGT